MRHLGTHAVAAGAQQGGRADPAAKTRLRGGMIGMKGGMI